MSEVFAPTYFAGLEVPHFLRVPMADNRLLYVLTGVAGVGGFHGTADGNWVRDGMQFEVPIPLLPDGQGLRLDHWTVYMSLNSVANDGEGDQIGFAVDTFWLNDTNRVRRSALVQCNMAVRDVDGWVLRLGYHIQLLGSVAPMETLH